MEPFIKDKIITKHGHVLYEFRCESANYNYTYFHICISINSSLKNEINIGHLCTKEEITKYYNNMVENMRDYIINSIHEGSICIDGYLYDRLEDMSLDTFMSYCKNSLRYEK